jgi:hypothetical protein
LELIDLGYLVVHELLELGRCTHKDQAGHPCPDHSTEPLSRASSERLDQTAKPPMKTVSPPLIEHIASGD